MDKDANRIWQIRVAAFAIFVLGFAAGALTLNIYRNSQAPSPAAERQRLDGMLERLNLTAEQQTQVKAIFGDARTQMSDVRKECGPKFREVRERTDARLREVLTLEQWQQWQTMTSEEREHHQHDRSDRPGEP